MLIQHLNLASGREVEVSIENDRIVLARPKYNLRELVEAITPENRHELTDWGPPVGKEIW